MPIKGLTDTKSVQKRFDSLGVIRKGIMHPDGKMEDLDYFRFVPTKGPYADSLMEIWLDSYGDKPTNIEVFLMYPTVEENWKTWMEAYGKTGLKFRCDGEYWVQWRKDDLTFERDYDLHQRKVCPYCSEEMERTKADPGDKAVGYLSVMLVPFFENAFTGMITVHTTSLNDLANISSALAATYEEAANHGRNLKGIPFNLMRVPEMVQTRYKNRDGDYVKKAVEKYMLHLMPSPEWARQALAASRRQAMLSAPMPALSEVDDDLPTEIVEAEVVTVFTKTPEGDLVAVKIQEVPMSKRVDNVPEEPPFDSELEDVLTEETVETEAIQTADKPDVEEPLTREVMTPSEVMGKAREHLERLRGKKFVYSEKDQDKKKNAKYKIKANLESVFEDSDDRVAVLIFLVGDDGKGEPCSDDPAIEILNKYLKVTKVDDKWQLEESTRLELLAIAEQLRKQPVEKMPSIYKDYKKMKTLAEKRDYASKLFNCAQDNGLLTMSYTDDTLVAFIESTEDMLKRHGVG